MLSLLDNVGDTKIVSPAGKRNTQGLEKHRMTLWLQERIARSQNEPSTEIVTLTPVLARLLLDLNPENRKLSEHVAEIYSRDMSAKRWQLNGESIIVSVDGFLNDGQHRCNAVIASGASIQTVIVFGIERESRLTVDQGKMRTAGDYLGMNGMAHSNHVAAICNLIWQYREKGRIYSNKENRPTKSEILLLASHYTDIAESIHAVHGRGVGLVGGITVLAFCHWEIKRKVGEARATEFTDSLIDGEKISGTLLVLRNRLVSKERLSVNEKIELIFRAWNAIAAGVRLKKLIALNGLLPKIVSR